MLATTKNLVDLTASDLMTRELIRLTEDMPLREAARQLLNNQIGGAPVVNSQGRCVGVLSATDFVRLAVNGDGTKPNSPALPITCSFQWKHRTADGEQLTFCKLPLGVCSIQVKQTSPDGDEMIICSQPHSVLADWQVVEVEKLPTDAARHYMTADPITVMPETSICVLARLMIDAHIHRVIVVDDEQMPIGIVTSTDILAAVAQLRSE